MNYKRLTNVERETIREQLTLGTSPSNIAVMLVRSRGTISRELKRGGHVEWIRMKYSPKDIGDHRRRNLLSNRGAVHAAPLVFSP